MAENLHCLKLWPVLNLTIWADFDFNLLGISLSGEAALLGTKNWGHLGCLTRFELWPQGWSLTSKLIFFLTRYDHYKVDCFSAVWLSREAEFLSPLTILFWKSLNSLSLLLTLWLGQSLAAVGRVQILQIWLGCLFGIWTAMLQEMVPEVASPYPKLLETPKREQNAVETSGWHFVIWKCHRNAVEIFIWRFNSNLPCFWPILTHFGDFLLLRAHSSTQEGCGALLWPK